MKKCHFPFLPSGFLFARRILKARALVLAIGMVAVISPSNLAADSPTLGPNLVVNPSFVSGAGALPDDWIPNPNATDATFLWNTTFGRTDSFSVKISASQRSVILSNPGWRTSDFIPIDQSKTYLASVFTFTPDGAGVGHIPAVQFFKADDTFLGTIGATGPSGLDDPIGMWVEKIFTFTPSSFSSLASATKVKLIVVQDIETSQGTTTTVFFDDVFFGEVVLYGVNASDDGLSIIDPTTGAVTFVGPLDPNSKLLVTPVAMAVRPSDGKIFVWNNSDEGETPNTVISTGVLLTVNSCSGFATKVDATTPGQGQLSALAFAPDGRLFGLDSDLFEIDTATGVRAIKVSLNGNRIAGAAFDASGTLFGLTFLRNVVTIDTVDPSMGGITSTVPLDTDVGTPGSIVFDPTTGTLIGSAFGVPFGNILFDINASTGAVANIRTLSGGFAPQGMGFAPACQLEEESVTKQFGPGVTTQTYSYDDNNHTFTVTFDGVLTTFDLTITAVDTAPGSLEPRLDPDVFPSGTVCIPYASGLCVVYRAEEPLPSPNSDFTGLIDILIKYFDPVPAPANPRMAHDRSDIDGDKFTEDMTVSFIPSLNPGTDPALRGRTTNWSHIVAVDLAITDPATFSGFLEPLGAGGKVFKLGRTIPVKFKLTDGDGNPVTDAVAHISVEKISNGIGGPVATDGEASGAANTDNLFRFGGGNYVYNLSTKGFTSGTYGLTVISTKFFLQTVTFVMK